MPIPKRPIRIEGNLAYVPLPHGREAIIDAEDAELVGQHNWHEMIAGYAATNIRLANGKQTRLLLHRLIMSPPEGLDIDHIHGNKFDNRKAQLRLATRSQNQQNQGAPANNTSGFKGVTWHIASKKWRSQICLNNKLMHLGCFDTAEEAHSAYCEAANRLHGEFARTE